MSRTIRYIRHWIPEHAAWLREYAPESRAVARERRARRMERGADGAVSTYILGSAKHGRLDTWDDVGKGSGRAGKRIANKQLRRWHNAEARRQMAEEAHGEEEEAKEAAKIAKEEEERNIELNNLIYSLEEARNERDFWQRIVNSLESKIKSFDMEEA